MGVWQGRPRNIRLGCEVVTICWPKRHVVLDGVDVVRMVVLAVGNDGHTLSTAFGANMGRGIVRALFSATPELSLTFAFEESI